jgi:hypothetical protein
MPQIGHFGTGEILGVGLMDHELLPGQVEGELLVGPAVDSPYVLEQRVDIHPLEIVCRRVPK